MRFFKKNFFDKPIRFNGSFVQFQNVGGNVGVRQIDEASEPELVAELESAADARRGGIVRISPEIFESMQKKRVPLTPSPRPRGVLPPLRLHDPEAVTPKSNGPPKSAVESAGGVLPNRPEPTAAKPETPPPGRRRSHAPGFSLNSARRSVVEETVRAKTAPEQ